MPMVCSAEKSPAAVVVELSLICCATVASRAEQTEPESVDFAQALRAPFFRNSNASIGEKIKRTLDLHVAKQPTNGVHVVVARVLTERSQ